MSLSSFMGTLPILIYPPTCNISGIIVLYENNSKYLGMTLHARLRWKEDVEKERTEIGYRCGLWQEILN